MLCEIFCFLVNNLKKIKLKKNEKLSRSRQNKQNVLCAQRRLSLAWASAQSGQSLYCALFGQLRTQTFFRRTVKTLIGLLFWVFAGRTCHFVVFFFVLWFISRTYDCIPAWQQASNEDYRGYWNTLETDPSWTSAPSRHRLSSAVEYRKF